MTYVDIPGETNSTYVTSAADVDCDIQLVVIAVNAAGNSLPAASNAIGLISASVSPVTPAGIASRLAFGAARVLAKPTMTVQVQGVATAESFGVPAQTGGGRTGQGGTALAGTDATISDGNLYDSRVRDGDVYAITPDDGSRWVVRVSDAMAA